MIAWECEGVPCESTKQIAGYCPAHPVLWQGTDGAIPSNPYPINSREGVSSVQTNGPDGKGTMIWSDQSREIHPAVREGVGRLLYACEAVRVVRLIEENGVAVVLYKGAALAEMAYGGSENRRSGDIDLLVGAEDFRAVEQVLESEGYRRRMPLPAWMLRKSRWGAPTLPYEMHYRNERTGAEVDLHTSLLPKDLGATLDEPALWRRLEEVEICGRLVRTLGAIDTLLFLALHGTKHQWESEGYVRDFGAFARARVKPEQWRIAMAEAAARGCRDMLLVAVRIAEGRLGFVFPAEASRAARRSPRVSKIAAWYGLRAGTDACSSSSKAGILLVRWRMWDTLPQRTGWLLRLAIVPNVRDFEWIQLPGPLGSFYYLLRPVRLAWQWLLRPVVARVKNSRRD